jgi:hypothetical protein
MTFISFLKTTLAVAAVVNDHNNSFAVYNNHITIIISSKQQQQQQQQQWKQEPVALESDWQVGHHKENLYFESKEGQML